jgi:hypothetical protein
MYRFTGRPQLWQRPERNARRAGALLLCSVQRRKRPLRLQAGCMTYSLLVQTQQAPRRYAAESPLSGRAQALLYTTQ